ncbi:MAG: hypothetical protein HKN22_05870 [Bacteroidia bacterium]|nr:hypothetical protein [Bacteroidia bacterium]
MEDRILFLHVGLHKTGTSALQFHFMNNENALANAGLLYPKTGRDTWGGHHLFFNCIKKQEYAHYKTESSFNDYIEELNKESKNFKKVLLSSELLSEEIELEQLTDLKKSFRKIKIIAFIRRQDRYLESSYSSFIRGGYVFTFKNYLKGRLVQYKDQLDKWANIFGKENIEVHQYDKENFENRSIFTYFLDLLDVEISEIKSENKRYNTSMNLDSLEFLRFFNLLNYRSKDLIEYCYNFSDFIRDADQKATSLFSIEERQRVISEYQNENKLISSEYFREGNELFDDKLNSSESESIRYRGLTELSLDIILKRQRSFNNKLFIELCDEVRRKTSIDMTAPQGKENMIAFLYKNNWEPE